ncbi:MAG: DMT family transporter [Pseudomonadota bacterium]
MHFSLQRHAGYALVAAALFGASTPLAKRLLGDVSPLVLAGFLYLGSGLGLFVWHLFSRLINPSNRVTALHGKDYFWLAGAILTGGIGAPVLLLWGLTGISASTTSLLLNFEGILTTILASFIFGEAVGKRIWQSTAVMLLAGSILFYSPNTEVREFLPALAVLAACLLWAVDNNLTRNISATDPVMVAMYKGLAAGSVNLGLAWQTGASLPATTTLVEAIVLGLCSYGLSLVLFIIALRHLGSARTSAHFGTAPFFGATLSILLLNEPVTASFSVGLAFMLFATWLILTEKHDHFHVHNELTHEHAHHHDEHHDHEHEGHEGPEPHSHVHVHKPLAHSHPHLPDLHHRHHH